MQFINHYSGSKGNLYEVQAPGHGRILIECGGTWKALIASLCGDLRGIHGCLISHHHADHAHNFEKLTTFGIPIHATWLTCDFLPNIARQRMLKVIDPIGAFEVGPFEVSPFETHHDAEGAVGFVVEHGTDALLFATDTTHISEQWDIPFTHIAIECSWDRERIAAGLKAGTINSYYADRLTTTHMEKRHTKLYLREYVNLSKCREIHLIHLSSTLDKDAVKAEFEDEFLLPIFIK